MPAQAKELLLPPTLGDSDAVALLGERLRLGVDGAHRDERVLLDTFDGRLRDAGVRAELRAGELEVHEEGAPVRRARVKARRRLLAGDLPEGVVLECLRGLMGNRALLPVASVRGRVQSLAVLNDDEKTVARLVIEHADVLAGSRRVGLPPRLTVHPVLGYDKDYDRTVGVLESRLGFADAGETLFDAAVRAAGGTPEGHSAKPRVALGRGTRADEAASLVLAALAEIAAENLPGAREDLDPEFLHHLRTSIRRARSVLREIDGVHDPDARAHVRAELKWAQAVTGPVRDLDVQLEDWQSLVGPLAPERAADLEALRAVIERRRETERARLARRLRSKRFSAALRAWQALAAAPPAAVETPERPRAGVPIEALAAKRIRTVYRRIVRDGRAIDGSSPPEALHDLRKRGKELRYLLELFGDSFPSDVVAPMVSALKDLQSVLGTYQDRAVQEAFLHGLADELATEPGGPRALIALGPVLDAVAADQEAARAAFSAAFGAFSAREQRRLVKTTFSKRSGA